ISNALLILARDRQIDILFANAGTGEFGPLGAITEEHFDKTFNGNVKGLLFSVQKALPLLKDGSSIILNASIVSSTGSPALSVYSASKAAVRSFARTFTADLKDRKIRVNAVSPGVIPSPGHRNALGLTDEQIKQYTGSAVDKIPLGRTGALDEVAKKWSLFLLPTKVATSLALSSSSTAAWPKSDQLDRWCFDAISPAYGVTGVVDRMPRA
ncbi:MAG: SDR family oxidoreductase, partial [Candidatus Acidiferrum sp.]